jgi:hypothetical protein
MDQSFINWLLGGVSGLLGALASLIFIGMRDLQKSQSRTDRRLSEIEVLVAGDYLKKQEFEKFVDRIMCKLDGIDEKIDRKADK